MQQEAVKLTPSPSNWMASSKHSSTRVTLAAEVSGLQGAQHFQRFRRLRSNRVIRVHVGCTNDSLADDHITRGQRQAVFLLVVEPVQRPKDL
jgi:hypothetical protein